MSADAVSRATLEALCSDYERALRAVCGEAGLPAEWDARLKGINRSSATGLLKYWKWLAIYSELYHERRHRGVASEEAEAAARQLLTREPVEVTLQSGRRVRVTGRSYAAMMEIARHERRIRALSEWLSLADRLVRRAGREIATAEDEVRTRLPRRRLRHYLALAERIQIEIVKQRNMLWAHALTPTGAPATEDQVPPWWLEIAPEDDLSLLMALHEAGPGRYTKLGPPPETKGGREKKGEDFGWAALLTSWGVRTKVPAAEMYDRDLGQVIAEVRVSAPPTLEEELS